MKTVRPTQRRTSSENHCRPHSGRPLPQFQHNGNNCLAYLISLLTAIQYTPEHYSIGGCAMASVSATTAFSIRVGGPLACFTRPEFKVERMSYPTITPSAARGVLEAVLWKPAILWHIDRIAVLSPIRFTAFRRNEVNNRAVAPTAAVVLSGGQYSPFFADDDRAQRNTVALSKVDYRVDAHFTMTGRAGPDDNPTKFVEMFRRRLASGQHFHQPYLGCREFIADVEPVNGDCPPAIPETRDLGIMLWDIVYRKGANRPVFFAATMIDGVVDVPPTAEAAVSTLKQTAIPKGAV
jgi:CRISPR-associated protein Cas5d